MHVEFGLKIPNRLGKMSQNFRGDFFDSHCRSVFACVESDCDIIQIAAMYGNTLFSRYVWPSKPIHPKASEVHKITVDKQQMYVDGKRVEHVDQRRAMTEFVQFIQQVSAPVVLVAHNGRRFDFPRSVYFVC